LRIKRVFRDRLRAVSGMLLVIILLQWCMCSLTFAFGIDSFTGNINNTSHVNDIVNNNNNGKNNTHAVIIAFDDAWKSQFTYAKPILDRFGFKASYFIVCNYVGKNPERMTWSDIQTLERQGHDIESHSMNHIPLDDLSQQQLNYEIGQSKQCIIDHSVSPNINNKEVPIFAYPYDIGHTNITVINTVAKYYQLGRTGDKPLAFLNCNLSLEDKKSRINETDYSNGECIRGNIPTSILFNGTTKNDNSNNKSSNLTNSVYYDTLLKVDRYSVRNWTHHIHNNINNSYNSTQMFRQFIQEVNSQDKYNSAGTINAIPIITYHGFTNTSNMNYSKNQYDTDVNLFFREMKYLYDHHFNVLPMSEIRYNRNSEDLYLNGLNR
jgi:peptidoglycan/xylan/chitin deacetylase (PgdA/CDA1 family)